MRHLESVIPGRRSVCLTQREAADQHGVDRSTVVHIVRTAKQGALDALASSVPGRPGQSPEAAALARAGEEIERLRATVAEQAVVLHLHEGKARGTECRPGPAQGGRDGQGRPARPGRRRRRCRLVDPAGSAAAGRGSGPGATVGPAARKQS